MTPTTLSSTKKLSDRWVIWCSCLGVALAGFMPETLYYAVVLMSIISICSKKGQWQRYHIWFIALACWTIISTTVQYAYSIKFSSTQLLFIYDWLPLLILPAIHWSPKEQKLIINTLIFALIYMTIIGILQSLFGADIHNAPFFLADGKLGLRALLDHQRLPNTWDHTDKYGYGVTLLFSFLCAYGAQEMRSRKYTIFGYGGWLFHFILHKNRGGLLATAALLPLTVCTNWSIKNLAKAYGLLMLIGIPFLICLCLAIPSLGNRVKRSLDLQDGRVPVWNSSMYLIQQEPLFGYGGKKNARTAYESVPAKIQGTEFIRKGYGTNAHNSLLSMICCYGFIGGLLWAISQISLFVYLYKNDVRSGLILLCSYQIIGLVYHAAITRPLSSILFLLIGLSIAFKQSNKIDQVIPTSSPQPEVPPQVP